MTQPPRPSIHNFFAQQIPFTQKQLQSSPFPQPSSPLSLPLSQSLAPLLHPPNFVPFDLSQLQLVLSCFSSPSSPSSPSPSSSSTSSSGPCQKFNKMFDRLVLYNKKLEQGLEFDIVNYKLHEFYYTTLKICCTKTQAQAEGYLGQVQKWEKQYREKRDFVGRATLGIGNKKKIGKGDDQIVRMTFKSNLPQDIDQYERKICTLSPKNFPKNKSIQAMANYAGNYKRQDKIKTFFPNDSSSDQNQDCQFSKNLQQSESPSISPFSPQLPNLHTYRTELLKMRKKIEQRQQKLLLQNLKKNQTRIQTQTSNNFYKPMRNRNDVFNVLNKTASQGFNLRMGQGVTLGAGSGVGVGIAESLKNSLGEDDGHGNSRRQQLDYIPNAKKQNYNIIVNSTSLGFHQIKKNSLATTLGLKPQKTSSKTFPKFFQPPSPISLAIPKQQKQEQKQKQNPLQLQPQAQPQPLPQQKPQNNQNYLDNITNISGLHLIRNPFQIVKGKKQKKKR